MMPLAWGAKVSDVFRDNVLGICERFDWSDEHPSWLMSCMAFESGESFSPKVRNAAGSGAVGLIQFMPATAAYLGTTPQDLALMSAEGQLEWVHKFFLPYAARIKNLPDMYMAILLPKYIGKPGNTALFQGGVGYRQNSGLDTNHDGVVTKDEAAAKVREKLVKGLREGYVWTKMEK